MLLASGHGLSAQNAIVRAWHNSLARYNYYYNAALMVSEVRDETAIAYRDNFKEVLSLYPVTKENELKGNAVKMDEVLKKCSHIIDKRSKSKWVDDAYLLMGDARFFKGELYAAVEVYEYVANNFKNTIPGAQAELNLITTYIQMEKYEDAEALYTKLSGKKDFPEKLKTQLHIAGAAVNIKQKKYSVAIKLLEQAIPKVRSKNQKIRYNFVLAQLYAMDKKSGLSMERYRKVIKLNPPYEFAFHAKLNMAKSINIRNRNEIRNAKLLLRDMLRDNKNKEYFDQIYYELGNLEIADKNDNGAITEYNNALRANGSDMGIKSSAYLALADLYFRQQNYENAQKFYDSAARTVDPSNPNYKSVQDKNLVLNELIKHLVNIREKDSLLRLAADKKLLEKTIDRLMKEARDRAELEKQDQEIKRLRMENASNQPGIAGVANASFPFYNQAARNKGLQDFQRIWGVRERHDFWAVSSNKSAVWAKQDQEMKSNDMGGAEKEKLLSNVPQERKPYYDNIPFTLLEKQKMKDEIAESYFLGANVYYQSLKEHDKAKKMLEDLNVRYPGSKYEINSWYLLARIHRDQKNEEKAQYYIDLISKADPKSSFLNVLLNNSESTDSSNLNVQQADDRIEQAYARAFAAYKVKNYSEMQALKRLNDSLYPGNPLQVNFDYLEALVYGEKNQLKEFQDKLQAIVDNYPETEIARQSARTIELIRIKNGEIPQNSGSSKYAYNASADHFYILVVPKTADFTKLKLAYLNYHKSFFPDDGLRVTNSLLGDQYQVLIVNNFKSLDAARAYIVKLTGNKEFFTQSGIMEPQQYLISKDNFSILISDKELSDYLSFYKTNYTF